MFYCFYTQSMKKAKIIIKEELTIKTSPKKWVKPWTNFKKEQAIIKKLFRHRRLLLFKWVLAIMFGVIALMMPESALLAIIWYFAIILIVIWVLLVFGGFSHLKDHKHGYLWIVEWLFDVATAIIIFFYPDITLQLLLLFLAVWAWVKWIWYIIQAIKIRKHVIRYLFNCVILLSFSGMLFYRPTEWLVAMSYVIWFFAIIFGIGISGLALKLRQLKVD